MNEHQYFAACPKGLESLLATELGDLGAGGLRETLGGVYFTASQQGAYRACLWSRLANRILKPLIRCQVKSAADIYQAVMAQPWGEYLPGEGALAVDFTGTSAAIRNSQYGAQVVKDAIVDQQRDAMGRRPSVSRRNPDLPIHARLGKGQLAVSLDLCGDSLHRRGYRLDQGVAPLKENLAAAILLRCGWPQTAAEGGALIDPMCGSGTLLIEAAMMALQRAPGLNRNFAFQRWLDFDAAAWGSEKDNAEQKFAAARSHSPPAIRGFDADADVLTAAQANIERAGMPDCIQVQQASVQQLRLPQGIGSQPGLIVTNPPYGERLGEQEELQGLYRALGDACRQSFSNWTLALFTGNPTLGKSLGLRAKKRYKLYNGPIASELLLIPIRDSQFVDAPPADLQAPPTLSSGAEMLVNRLAKNRRQLARWIDSEGIDCYRIYDADMPEYAVAVDVYRSAGQTYLHVQEYAAPKSVDEERARRRFAEVRAAVAAFFDSADEFISCKQRRRNRGKRQYERQTHHKHGLIPVREGEATLLINLWEYLDTGLFLDHRPVRRRIAEHSAGKRFLNLFCYTASATVQAALGGASETVSVDMSHTYLDWARKNLAANRLSERRHRLIQSDCRQWLQDCREGFDLILLDPPSFSNSKRMEGVLDIQRDHVALISHCMELLLPGGQLIFSTNLRSFRMDEEALSRYELTDITRQTLDPDFRRQQKIHQCWSFGLSGRGKLDQGADSR